MAQTGIFGHDDPAPISRDAYTRIARLRLRLERRLGREHRLRAVRRRPTVMTAWINSEGHRVNLDNPSFRAIGVGVAADCRRPHLLGAGLRQRQLVARRCAAARAAAAAASSASAASAAAPAASAGAAGRPRSSVGACAGLERAGRDGRADRERRRGVEPRRHAGLAQAPRSARPGCDAAKPHAGDSLHGAHVIRPRAGGDVGARGALSRAALAASASRARATIARPRRDVHLADPGRARRRAPRSRA